MKNIMIVAGGEWQVPLIKKAKSAGCFVINTNLYENSIGFQYADIGIVADVLDKEKNLEIARKYKPDAIITDQSDIAVSTVAYLCDEMGLCGIGYETSKLFTNKFLMREFCRKNGFAYPKYRLCASIEEVIDFFNENKFPIIIKPLNNQSSRGVNKIDSIIDLNIKYKNTFENSRGNSSIIAEEYIEGTEFTIEGFKTEDKHFSLAISKKEHFSFNNAIASSLLYKSYDAEYDYEELIKINNSLIEKMGLKFGITHAEYKYSNGKFYLIESAARGGGTKISSHIIPIMSGVDVNKYLIQMALGEEIDETQLLIKDEYRSRCAILEFLNFESGKVKKIKGMEKIREIDGVIDLALNFIEGDYIIKPTDDRSRLGYFIAYSNNIEQLNKVRDEIKDNLVIEYE